MGPDLTPLIDAVEAARPDGRSIERWSIYGTTSRRARLGTKDDRTGNAHAPMSFSEAAGARYLLVWDDGRISRGFVERCELEEDALAAVERTRATAFDDPDAARVAAPAPLPDVPLHDDGTAILAKGEIRPIAERFDHVRRCTAEGGFRTWSGSISAGYAEARLRTSSGVDFAGRGTSFGWYVGFDGVLGTGWSGRSPDAFDAFERRVEVLADRATALREPASAPAGGVVPVLLDPSVVEAFVIPATLHHFQGATVANGEGRFGREHFARRDAVFRDDLSVRVDPLLPLRAGSYRFTLEGVPAAPCTYLDRGCLVTPILDFKYARRLGREPTPVPHGTDALFLECDTVVDEAAGRDAAAVWIFSVLGVHTQDFSSGDFSLSAPQGLRLGDGEFRGRLGGTISGNLFEVLRSPAMRFVRFEGEHTPGILAPIRFDAS